MNPQENEPQNQPPVTPPVSPGPPEPSPVQAPPAVPAPPVQAPPVQTPPVEVPAPDPQTPQVEPVQQPDAFAPIQEQPVVQSQPDPTPFASIADTSSAVAQQPDDPGKTLGIVGFVMSLLAFGPISLVISIIARQKSKKAGHSNGLALAGIILSAISIIVGAVAIALLVMGGMKVADYCEENGRTVTTADGSTTYECNAGTESDTAPAVNETVEPGL